MNRFIMTILVAVILSSCSKKEQELPADNREVRLFTMVYTNYLMAALQDSSITADRSILLDSALVRAGVSMDEFKKALFYLRSNPEAFDAALTTTIDSLEKVARGGLPGPQLNAF